MTNQPADLAAFVAERRPGLERALVARFGLGDGLEAAAAAFAYAAEHWDRVAGLDNPAGYLYMVGVNSARRGHERQSRVELLVVDPATTETVVDIDLQRALCQLTPDQRVAVVLVHAHGYTYADAAQQMGTPATTLTNHVHRGLARLRTLLES